MSILSLVPEQAEESFNQFINNGIIDIANQKSWCGLTMQGFRDWFNFEMQLDNPKTHSKTLGELLNDYVECNKETVVSEFEARRRDEFESALVTQFEQLEISNNY